MHVFHIIHLYIIYIIDVCYIIYLCVHALLAANCALLWPPEGFGSPVLLPWAKQKRIELAKIFHFRHWLDFSLWKLQRCICSFFFLSTSCVQQAVTAGEYYKEQCRVWKKELRKLTSEREGARELEAEQCGEEPADFSSRRKLSSFLPVTTDMSCTVFGNRGTWQAADRTCSALAALLWPSS